MPNIPFQMDFGKAGEINNLRDHFRYPVKSVVVIDLCVYCINTR